MVRYVSLKRSPIVRWSKSSRMYHVSSFHNVNMGQSYIGDYSCPFWVHVSYMARFRLSKNGHLVYTWYDKIGLRAHSIDVNMIDLVIDIIGMVYVIYLF